MEAKGEDGWLKILLCVPSLRAFIARIPPQHFTMDIRMTSPMMTVNEQTADENRVLRCCFCNMVC